jgi:hypothetical protein
VAGGPDQPAPGRAHPYGAENHLPTPAKNSINKDCRLLKIGELGLPWENLKSGRCAKRGEEDIMTSKHG